MSTALSIAVLGCGRGIEVHGTLAALKGGSSYSEAGSPELWLRHHATGNIESIEILQPKKAGYAGHGGGDFVLVDALEGLFQGAESLPPGLDGLAGHRLAFLAEKARVSHAVINRSDTSICVNKASVVTSVAGETLEGDPAKRVSEVT